MKNFESLLWHTAHFDKSTVLLFFALATFGFLLSAYIFLTRQTIAEHYLINILKSLINLIKSLNFWFLFSFRSLYYFKTFIKPNSSWLITQFIKALEIKTSISLNLDFAKNSILSCFFFCFLFIYLYFLITAIIAQIFNPNAELVNPIARNTNQRSKSRKWNISSNYRITNTKVFNII